MAVARTADFCFCTGPEAAAAMISSKLEGVMESIAVPVGFPPISFLAPPVVVVVEEAEDGVKETEYTSLNLLMNADTISLLSLSSGATSVAILSGVCLQKLC